MYLQDQTTSCHWGVTCLQLFLDLLERLVKMVKPVRRMALTAWTTSRSSTRTQGPEFTAPSPKPPTSTTIFLGLTVFLALASASLFTSVASSSAFFLAAALSMTRLPRLRPTLP